MLSKKFEYGRRDVWLLRTIAIVFSIFLWMAVIGGKKTEANKSVKLEFRLPEGLVIANQLPEEIVFKVKGPNVFLRELETRSLSIPIDMQSSGVGEHEVVVSEDRLDVPLGLEVVSVTPKKFKVKLDRLAKKHVTVRPILTKQLPEGFKVTQVLANPSTVVISGPQRNLRYIDSIPTEELKIATSPLKQEFEAKLNFADFPGVQVADGIESVYVAADLTGPSARKRMGNINVALKVGSGKSARVVTIGRSRVKISPQKVSLLLEGSESSLDELSNSNLDVWVEIPSLKAGVYRPKLLWSLPPDLRVLRRSTDYVEVIVR
ncbi:hypothetical protein GW915_04280 [bacterium]|nr:hypothetical protein [bacterium]